MLGIRKLKWGIDEVTNKSNLQQKRSGHWIVWDGRKVTKCRRKIVKVTKLCKVSQYDFAVPRLLNPQMPETHLSNVTFTERNLWIRLLWVWEHQSSWNIVSYHVSQNSVPTLYQKTNFVLIFVRNSNKSSEGRMDQAPTQNFSLGKGWVTLRQYASCVWFKKNCYKNYVI